MTHLERAIELINKAEDDLLHQSGVNPDVFPATQYLSLAKLHIENIEDSYYLRTSIETTIFFLSHRDPFDKNYLKFLEDAVTKIESLLFIIIDKK